MNIGVQENNTKFIFNDLVRDIQLPLFQFIFSLLPHKQDAEDVLQKTNLILCEKQDAFDPTLGSFKTWAFKIARYQVMGFRTHQGRSRISFSNELADTLAEEAKDYDTPKIQKDALNKCYKKLPQHMQSIADLRFKRDLTMKEISRQTNRSVGAVSATLHRIRGNIMRCIDQAYKEAEYEFYNQ